MIKWMKSFFIRRESYELWYDPLYDQLYIYGVNRRSKSPWPYFTDERAYYKQIKPTGWTEKIGEFD